MDKSNLMVAVIAFALTACAATPEPPKPRPREVVVTAFDPGITRRPQACIISVFVAVDVPIIVDQEPAYIKSCVEGNHSYLYWRLEAGSGNTFTSDSAVWFKGPSQPTNQDCKVQAGGQVIKCTFTTSPTIGTVYPYGIRVRLVNGTDAMLDPTVFRD